jgi:CRP-like cAMP-binding protein
MLIGVPSALFGKYRETIKAMEDLEVLPIKKDDFIQFMLADRQVSYYFLNQLAMEQIRADEKLLLQAFGTVRMKLASTLLELYPLYQVDGIATISISREELANIAGTAKETIIRCLSEFKEEGLISIKDSDIIIDSPRKLNELQY